MHADCRESNSSLGRVSYIFFTHTPPPKASPGSGVPSPSSCPHWCPPYQEGVGWVALAIAGSCVPSHTCDSSGQHPAGSMRKQRVFCACILLQGCKILHVWQVLGVAWLISYRRSQCLSADGQCGSDWRCRIPLGENILVYSAVQCLNGTSRALTA